MCESLVIRLLASVGVGLLIILLSVIIAWLIAGISNIITDAGYDFRRWWG